MTLLALKIKYELQLLIFICHVQQKKCMRDENNDDDEDDDTAWYTQGRT